MDFCIDNPRNGNYTVDEVHKMRIRGDIMRINIEVESTRLQKTKTEMSQELGVTYKTYNSYINGKTPIPSDILEKLRDITGRSIDYLLGLQTDNAS